MFAVCVRLAAGKAKYASGEVYVGQWHKGLRHGQGKWTSAPRTVNTQPTAAQPAGSTLRANHIQRSIGQASIDDNSRGSSNRPATKEGRDKYVGGWAAGKREGHGVCDYADGDR